MSTFERHCQLLLRAYPATYRQARGEEIIGTLLEATPPGRSWPLPRDVRCLIAGGFRARAAQPRQFTTAGNLRAAVLAGIAAYLAFSAAVSASVYLSVWAVNWQPEALSGWQFAAITLPLVPSAVIWLSRRRLIVLAAALPAVAATCYAGPWQGIVIGSTVGRLAFLAALVALAGYAERPGWRWSWPLGLFAIAPLPLAVAGRLSGLYLLVPLLALSIASIAWIVIDARPAIAMAVFLLAIQLPVTIGLLAAGAGFQLSTLFALIVIAMTAVAVWRLRRQSADPGRPAQA